MVVGSARTGPASHAERARAGGDGERLGARRVPAPALVLRIASLGVFAALLDATIVNVAFPSIARSFPGASVSQLSWVLSAYNLTFAAFVVAGGRIADLLGRRRIFSAALAGFTLASCLCAAAPSAGVLIATRVLQAAFAALLLPASRALVLAAYSGERRRHAIAIWTAVSAAAAGLGPPLGALLVSASDWRLVFLVNLPVGVVGLAMARRHLIESRAHGRRAAPDLIGASMLAIATALLVLGIVQGHGWGWGSARIIGAFAAALALGLAFVWRCASVSEPVIDLALLRIRGFSVANAMMLVSSAGFYGTLLSGVLFLTGVWRYSILQAGLALTPGPALAIVFANLSSRAGTRVGVRSVLAIGGVVWVGALLWPIEQLGARPDFLTGWLPAMCLFGVGAGLTIPSLGAVSAAAAPGSNFASTSALNTVARQIGAALGVALTVTLIGTPSPAVALGAFHRTWWFAAGCFLFTALGSLALGPLPAASVEDQSVVPASALRSPALPRPHAPRARRPLPESLMPPTAPTPAESVADFLRRVPILAGIDQRALESLSASARSVVLEPGDWLFREGDEASGMFVVRSGRLEVVAPGPPPAVLRQLGRGEAVGELSLITAQRRSASVRAARQSTLIAIDAAVFSAQLAGSAALPSAVAVALATQLRQSRAATPRERPVPATIAMVALGDAVPVRAVAERLCATLGRHHRVAVLDGHEAVDPAFTSEPAAAFGPLLARCEADHDQVILSGADATSSDPWTRYCLQEADRILVLTSGGSSPPPGRIEALPACELVGIGIGPGSGGLAGWVAALDAVTCHALRDPEDQAGLARIARRLTGRAVGVVLGGGGAPALAHIGVLEELARAGIVIDRVAGVGVGAYVGALLAVGHSPEEIDARCYEDWVRGRPLGDYRLSRHSLVRGERLGRMLGRTFGATAIEELAIGFSCASADLLSGELVTARDGAVAEAVQAALTLPVLSPPVARDGRLLVDGAWLDDLPTGPVRWLGEGPVIGVRVTPAPAAAGAPGQLHQPTVSETLTRLLSLAGSRQARDHERPPELLISVSNPQIGPLEFYLIDAAQEAGRRAARAALERFEADSA